MRIKTANTLHTKYLFKNVEVTFEIWRNLVNLIEAATFIMIIGKTKCENF